MAPFLFSDLAHSCNKNDWNDDNLSKDSVSTADTFDSNLLLNGTDPKDIHGNELKLKGKTPSQSDAESDISLTPPHISVINAVRILSVDAIENSKSGHPGLPLGMAPTATILWDKHMKFSPRNPGWVNRDRFVLSAGHGSMLQYALMYLFGYDSINMNDIKSFRKLGSRASGHPENIITPGVEVMTGALGQGISNAVGIALAESHLAALYNRPNAPPVVDHFTYCIVGDGCLMEGVASEVCSLAAHWKLGKLIVIYDDNSISIEGSTDLAFTENVAKRFDAYGWHVIEVSDGNTDFQAIDSAIAEGKSIMDKPTLIKVTTTIGYGAPTKAGTESVHGSCLGAREVEGLREALEWPYPPFWIPNGVLDYTRRKREHGDELERIWKLRFKEYKKLNPELANSFETLVIQKEMPNGWPTELQKMADYYESNWTKPISTRQLSHAALNALAGKLPHLIGGSADLGPSNLTGLRDCGDYQSFSRTGRNLHFGVREHGMAAIANGLALYGGGLIPFCATFFVFSDYCRAAMRTASLSRAGVIFIMTHDSVLLGEDGPTHQPIEHLASFRAMPGIYTFRPAEATELATCYELAVQMRDAPSILVLSRQKYVCPKGKAVGTRHGGYIFSDNSEPGSLPSIIFIATGSEVSIAEGAANELREEGKVVRVVSMPCIELFQQQCKKYQASVLPGAVSMDRRIVIEAGSRFGWERYASHFHTIESFGISAPQSDIAQVFKLTAFDVAGRARGILEGTLSYTE